MLYIPQVSYLHGINSIRAYCSLIHDIGFLACSYIPLINEATLAESSNVKGCIASSCET